MALIVFKQTLIMAVYMAIGFVLIKTKKLTVEGTKSFANFTVYIVVSCVLFNSFLIEYTDKAMKEFVLSFLLALFAIVVSNLFGSLIFKKDKVADFSVSYSNIGFMGIPIITACFGSHASFYIVGYLILFNMFQWNFSVPKLRGDKAIFNIKSILFNHFTIVSVVGFIFFITGLGTKVPDNVKAITTQLGNMNTPMAMILLGTYVAQVNFEEVFKNYKYILVSFIRLIIVPAVTILVFYFIGAPKVIKTTVMISAAAPVATNTAIYAQLFNRGYKDASIYVSLSTILSIATLPAVVYICEKVF